MARLDRTGRIHNRDNRNCQKVLADSLFTPHQFLRPLEAIRLEHDRQLLLCERLLQLANDQEVGPVAQVLENLLAYLTSDLPLHAMDEEEDLFPLMKLRCHPGDGFDAVLAQLEFEHSVEKVLAHHIVIDLKEIAGARALSSSMRIFADLQSFTECQQRHLAWENGTVLPLASKWLTPADLAEMGRNMAARRGITMIPQNVDLHGFSGVWALDR